MNKKAVLGLLLIMLPVFFPGTLLSGLNLDDLIGREQAAALKMGEKPLLTQFKNPQPQLVPRYNFLQGVIESVRQELEPSVMAETLRLYTKPPEAEKTVWSASEETGIYNAVMALSSLAGLQYFSASRGTMRTFYETSYVIDGLSTKKRIPDPVYPVPLSEISLYTRQKDLTFGDNIYQYDFYSMPGSLVFIQQNLTTLTVGPIPAVGKNKLRSIVAVLDSGDYLLIYAASMAKAVSLPGMNERVGNSFSNRVEAVLNWFTAQADKAFDTIYSR